MDNKSEFEFFAGMTPGVVIVLGTCVMQLLTEEQEITRGSMAEMVEALYCNDMDDLAVQLALDVLTLPDA